MVWLVGARAHAADDPAIRQVLDRAANQHPTAGSAVRTGPWNADTVRRLAAWLQGNTGAATPADLALMTEELRRPVALIISGAASLGSYQGGFLYYYLRQLTQARRLAERTAAATGEQWFAPGEGSPLQLITGASSGSINAVIAALTSCQTPVSDPRQSLFWTTWIPVGGAELTSAVEVQPDGLLSTRPIREAVERMQAAWNSGAWSPDQTCSVDLGLSATRTRSRTVTPLDDPNLQIPRQSEQMMITLRGGRGQMPAIGRFVPQPGSLDEALFLKLFPRVGALSGPPTFADVTDILWASSAFSFAFPPHLLRLTAGDSPAADDASYTDGGVFDNRPAGLAVRMQRWRLGAAGEASSHTRYIVQDPDITAWRPSKPPAEPAPATPPLFVDTWSAFASDFLDTAFTAELMNAIEREPTLYAGIEIPPRRVPVAGAYLMEFLSFAEQDFRVYDFFTGMVDAWQQLASTSLVFQVMAAANQTPTFTADAPEFGCLLAWRAHQLAGAPPTGDDACAAVGQSPADPILRDNMLALVHASAMTLQYSKRSGAKKSDPSDEQFFLHALGEPPAPGRPGYRFRDLTYRGKPATAGTITLAIRDVIQDLIERTTFNQANGVGRFAVGAVGKSLANFYAYRPPVVFGGIGLSTERGFELNGGLRLPFVGYFPPVIDLRLDFAFRLLDLETMTVDQPPNQLSLFAFTYMGAAHLTNEWQFQRWAPALQAIAQFHTGFGWAIESLQNFNGPLMLRHGPELTVGASLFQRLTLEVSATWWQDDCAGNNRCAGATPSLAERAAPLVDSSFALRVALGFRFFVN
jgi:predicted acylesterase/phospholipase RssA